MKLRGLLSFSQFLDIPKTDSVIVTKDGSSFDLLHEGKWISGRFDRNIRIDHPTHGIGQTHAHVLGRKRQKLVIVNVDGSGSHGSKGRLHRRDADVLRAHDFKIPDSNIIEWILLPEQPLLLFG